MVLGIIGAGASGMAAALAAAENPKVQVLLFERQVRVGKKLLATGNGRCNVTNLKAASGGYHGQDAAFADYAIGAFSPKATLEWFSSLGLFTVAEDSGRVYPYSDQANSVVDVLRFALDKPNIQLICGFDVQKVKKTASGFLVDNGEITHCCDRLIIACGGLAGTKLGGSMAGYKLLGKLGHHCTKLRPALVQIKAAWPGIVALKGVRANCQVTICHERKAFAQSTGELQFTELGLSGPVIFEISRDVCQEKGQWTAVLDFLPDVGEEALFSALAKRKETNLPVEELLTGILHNRLGRVLTKTAGIPGGGHVRDLPQTALWSLCKLVKGFEVGLTEPLGMDSAQVTAGGILTEEFNPQTMESKLLPGLYACGEVLDIDGDCGGYNLQWAWSSGRCAGLQAGKDAT